MKLKTLIALIFIATVVKVNSQAQENTDLYQVLMAKDSLLFEVGFNQCNLSQIEKLTMDDIEFYHDKDGITKSRKKFIASIKNNLCSTGSNVLKRVLNKGSVAVFPLYRGEELYGAIQNGSHSFGQTQATYSHLWLLEKEEWKLSRVLSYNHHQSQVDLKNNRIALSEAALNQYVGEYEFSPEFVLTIRVKDAQLYGGSQGQEVKINCYEEHKFIDDGQTHDLEFLIDEKGTVTGLLMKGSGMEMTAERK